MRFRTRYVSKGAKGAVSREEAVVEVERGTLALGRGTDNDVYLADLRVAYHHARLVVRDFDVVLEAVEGAAVRIDGFSVDRAVVGPDSRIEIGPYAVRLLPSDGRADLTLEIELVSAVPEEDLAALLPPRGQRLADRRIGRRSLSWVVTLLVLAATLALPLMAYRTAKPKSEGFERGELAAVAAPGPLATLDRIWSSGELSASHKFLDQRCDACHQSAFVRVESRTCAGCHDDTQHHFPADEVTLVDGAEPARCASCHREHMGPQGSIPARSSLCISCHERLDRIIAAGGSGILPITGFTGDQHVQFRARVMADPRTGRTETARLVVDSKTHLARVPAPPEFPEERSGLKFPHSVHVLDRMGDGLTAKACVEAKLKVQKADDPAASVLAGRCDVDRDLMSVLKLASSCGRGPDPSSKLPGLSPQACSSLQARVKRLKLVEGQLTCGNCHQVEPGGAYMAPVSMQEHCADCHNLRFDNDDPSRLLPHGHPDQVVAAATDYYVAKALRAPPPQSRSNVDLRQRAGAPSPVERQQQQLKSARESVDRLVEDIFTRSVCYECHETQRRPGELAWDVTPVRLASRWMQPSRFDHSAHTQTDCSECHPAQASTNAGDVLLPGIGVCQRCHGDETSRVSVPSTCTMCHDYHREDLPPLLPVAGTAQSIAASP